MNKEYKMTKTEVEILEDLTNKISGAYKQIKEFSAPLSHMNNLCNTMKMSFGSNVGYSDQNTELDFLSFLQQLQIQNTIMRKTKMGGFFCYDIGKDIEPLMKAVEERIEKEKAIPEYLGERNGQPFYRYHVPPPVEKKKRGRPKKQ